MSSLVLRKASRIALLLPALWLWGTAEAVGQERSTVYRIAVGAPAIAYGLRSAGNTAAAGQLEMSLAWSDGGMPSTVRARLRRDPVPSIMHVGEAGSLRWTSEPSQESGSFGPDPAGDVHPGDRRVALSIVAVHREPGAVQLLVTYSPD